MAAKDSDVNAVKDAKGSDADAVTSSDESASPFGAYLRSQRKMAKLTLRELSKLTDISNPYLSQIERGLHKPSVAVITSIANALNLSAETLLAQAAGLGGDVVDDAYMATELAIRNDPGLTTDQKQALLTVYRSYVEAN